MKTVLITGGVRGIGLGIARAFQKKGYEVIITYSKDEESAKKAKDEGFTVVLCDVKSESQVQKLFSDIKKLDVLVNNAGVSLIKQIQDTTLEEAEFLMRTNFTGAFLCSREAVKKMLRFGGGLIVNIASVWGETGASCESVYSASKAALIGFTKSLSKELAPSDIRVNSVSPGVIDTAMNRHFSKEELSEICKEIPLQKMGSPMDVASAVVFLEENEYITGVDLPVGGGFGF